MSVRPRTWKERSRRAKRKLNIFPRKFPVDLINKCKEFLQEQCDTCKKKIFDHEICRACPIMFDPAMNGWYRYKYTPTCVNCCLNNEDRRLHKFVIRKIPHILLKKRCLYYLYTLPEQYTVLSLTTCVAENKTVHAMNTDVIFIGLRRFLQLNKMETV